MNTSARTPIPANPLIDTSSPSETLTNCQEILALTMTVAVCEHRSPAAVDGLWRLADMVSAALDYEICAQRPWMPDGKEVHS